MEKGIVLPFSKSLTTFVYSWGRMNGLFLLHRYVMFVAQQLESLLDQHRYIHQDPFDLAYHSTVFYLFKGHGL